MKIKHLITTSVLALVGVGLTQTSVSAQSASEGDLLLGFRINNSSDTDTTGLTNNLEVDLGTAAYFTNLEGTGDVVNLNVGTGVVNPDSIGNLTPGTAGGTGGLSVTDLQNIYGNGTTNGALWSSRSDLVFGIAGTNGLPSKESFLTTPGTTALPVGGSEGFYASIQNLYSGIGGGTAGTGTTAGDVSTGQGTSWSKELVVGTNNDFGTGYVIEGGVSSSGATSLELFDITKTKSTEVGTFVLGSNGSFNFDATGTPVTTPEPSTSVMFGLSAVALLFMRRRLMMKA
jgi:hypothetical protein